MKVMLSLFLLKCISFASSVSHPSIKRHWRQHKLFSTADINVPINPPPTTGDVLLSGLNEDQDISIKIVSCREIVQESMLKNDLSVISAKALGELLTCCLMMGSGLKNQESLQINLGVVGVPAFKLPGDSTLDLSVGTLLGGAGEIQVVRNHPSYKRPTNGIVQLRDTSVALNLAFYLAESEQRTAAMITDVRVDGHLCRNALGILVETLPGANEENVEKCIANLRTIELKGLSSYLVRTETEQLLHNEENSKNNNNSQFRSFELCLQRVLDDCLINLGQSISWTKTPHYACSCNVDKIWRVLRLLPKTDIVELIETQNNVEFKCEFCGKEYHVAKDEIERELLNVGGSSGDSSSSS